MIFHCYRLIYALILIFYCYRLMYALILIFNCYRLIYALMLIFWLISLPSMQFRKVQVDALIIIIIIIIIIIRFINHYTWNFLWDHIPRLLNRRRATLDLFVSLTLWRARGANQQPYILLHIGARRAMHYTTGEDLWQWQFVFVRFVKLQVLEGSSLCISVMFNSLVNNSYLTISFKFGVENDILGKLLNKGSA